MTRAALLLLPLCSCTLLDLSFEGSACAVNHPCPGALVCDLDAGVCGHGASSGGCTSSAQCSGGQVCNPFTAQCASDALCHVFDGEHPVNCPRHDFYVAPTGDDAHDGTTPATAWATVSAHMLNPGDRVNLLAGEYTAASVLVDPMGSGDVSCPVEVSGPQGADAGTATVKQFMRIGQPGWWLHDLTFALGGSDPSLQVYFVDNIRLERLRFQNAYDGTASPRDLETNDIGGLQILDSDFESTESEMMLLSGGTNTVIEGNRFVGHNAHLQIPGDTVLRNNDFTGSWNGSAVEVTDGTPALIVERNVFHEMLEDFSHDFTVVDGAARVVSNTFINIDTGLAASTGVFRDNIVSGLRGGSGLSAADAGSGYNLFDQVGAPYATGDAGVGDVFAAAGLDANEVPNAGSAAIDAADPKLPVPPGGGTRADIGARERGATLTPDGRYCLPETP